MIYGRLATGCGYSRRVIDEMTLPEVLEQFAYWRRHPPTHELVAAYVGFQPGPEAQDRDEPRHNVEDFARLVKATTGSNKYVA